MTNGVLVVGDVSISKTNKSLFIKDLPATAVVVKPTYQKVHKPEVLEQIAVPTTGDSQLVVFCRNAGDLAETMALQRKLSPKRREEYEKDIVNGRMPSITVEILILKYDNSSMILADGRTRLAAAARANWSGILNINVRLAECKDDAVAFIIRLDSAMAKRSRNEMIGYVFGNEVSKKHVGLVNSAVQNIRWGCPGEDMANIKESNPFFPRNSSVTGEQLNYLHEKHMQDYEWLKTNFSGDKNRLLAVGIVTAIVLTKLIDGPEVADIWKRFVSGENLSGPLKDFRNELVAMSVRPAGQAGQTILFRKAMHAYLAEKQLFNAHLCRYRVGQIWQISHGKISTGSPESDRKKTKKAA
jgi:hypothetical protein